jgi:UDP-N-acetylglucosamine 2-epimerase (non-hydrolysing)
MLVFGTRPEAIKMCPLVKEFQKHPTEFETIVCVTGQHREMLDQVLKIFEVTPDYDLNIMKQGQDLYDVTARVLVGMRDVLKAVQPDVVLSDLIHIFHPELLPDDYQPVFYELLK